MYVLVGQRRAWAAVVAGRDLIPVMIIDSPEEAKRIVTQIVENTQRAELTAADDASACTSPPSSAATVTKKIGRTKTTVESALKAKSSTTGTKVVEDGYTLDTALVMLRLDVDRTRVAD